MSDILINGNLKIAKTHKTLLDALSNLLNKRNFSRLTVNDICSEAWLSRTAFYAHFQDKYDLLRYWLDVLAAEINGKRQDGGLIEFVNGYLQNNCKLVSNILSDANVETVELIKEFLHLVLNLPQKDKNSPKQLVLSDFCVGGLYNCLMRQLSNRFPDSQVLLDENLIKILDMVTEI